MRQMSCLLPCFETLARLAPQHEDLMCFSKLNLILRSIAKRCVSKDGQQFRFCDSRS
jgi:hypothetical protein